MFVKVLQIINIRVSNKVITFSLAYRFKLNRKLHILIYHHCLHITIEFLPHNFHRKQSFIQISRTNISNININSNITNQYFNNSNITKFCTHAPNFITNGQDFHSEFVKSVIDLKNL